MVMINQSMLMNGRKLCLARPPDPHCAHCQAPTT
jgi:hypothetical protein